jgi:sarcosine oxidase subunit beta
MMATGPVPPVFRFGLALDWGSVYWRQADDGAIVVGGCQGLAEHAESATQEEIDPAVQNALDAFLPRSFPSFPPFDVRRRWVGTMDNSADGVPLVGPVPERAGEFVIGGFGGHGIPGGLGAGRMLAQAITTGWPQPGLRRYDPGRFTSQGGTQREVNT